MRRRWRPPTQPDRVIKVVRTTPSGEEDEVVFSGFVYVTGVSDGMAECQLRAPASALAGMPLPWDPPMLHGASDREGVEHWWRQIHYVFDLPDPRLFQSLPVTALPDGDRIEILSRFVRTTADLASSQMITFDARLDITLDDATDEPVIAGANLPGRDIQTGFAVLLRQCLSPNDSANFDTVGKILADALERSEDTLAGDSREELSSWTKAIRTLRERSLEQLVRDRLAREEGMKVFDYQEPVTPGRLLKMLNYGDLIHWGDHRERVIVETEDEVESVRQRMAYFDAATGLAHLLIGFGVLVRAATAPAGKLFLP